MNDSERMRRIQELFHASLERSGEARAQYLNQACADAPDLYAEVEALLAAHDEDDDFLASSAQSTAILAEAPTQQLTRQMGQTISHYQVISMLGKGGMGEVYLATDNSLGRKAALKILPARYTTNADLVHRFEREAKAASALNHPNILTVYEIGKTEESHFIATELIEGETLRQRIARGALPLDEALDIALQIAAALTAAHEAGIIHRDIKPENIMLRPDGYVKVLDFGLAKLTETTHAPDESTTQTGLIMGTPSYMSPEQARGQKVDARTDLWSLGVVLYEMVSHARPFGGDSQADLLVAILEREPMMLPAGLPPELIQIIHLALSKDPNNRYATAREFGQALKAVQHKLAFASELKQFTAPSEELTRQQLVEAPTLQIAPAIQTDPGNQAPAVLTSAIPAQVPTQLPMRNAARFGFAGVLLALVLGLGLWLWLRPTTSPALTPTPPETTQPKREFTWWLTAQRMQNGKLEGQSFQSAGRDWFPNGSKFKFNLISPQTGFLYLLNEGLTTGGVTSLNLLYPTPKSSNNNAAVAANQPSQSDNYEFDQHQGEEKFWIVWSAQPIAEIETAKAAAAVAKSEIKDETQRKAILALLNQQATKTESQTDETKEQTLVTAPGDVAVSLVRLKHR